MGEVETGFLEVLKWLGNLSSESVRHGTADFMDSKTARSLDCGLDAPAETRVQRQWAFVQE